MTLFPAKYGNNDISSTRDYSKGTEFPPIAFPPVSGTGRNFGEAFSGKII